MKTKNLNTFVTLMGAIFPAVRAIAMEVQPRSDIRFYGRSCSAKIGPAK